MAGAVIDLSPFGLAYSNSLHVELSAELRFECFELSVGLLASVFMM